MAKQKYIHIPLDPEQCLAARKLLMILNTIPASKSGEIRISSDHLRSLRETLEQVRLSLDDIDVLENLLNRIGWPTDHHPGRDDALLIALDVKLLLEKGECNNKDAAYVQVADKYKLDKSTVGKHFRKHFPAYS